MSITSDKNVQICWQLWLHVSCVLFPSLEVTSEQGQWEEYRSCKASALWAGWPFQPPSPRLHLQLYEGKLSLVRGALNPKCKELMLCLENHSCQMQGGKCLAESSVIFPYKKLCKACSENHCTSLFCNNKEITSRSGCSWVWALFNSLQGSGNLLKVGLWSRVLPEIHWHKKNGDS